VGITKPQIQESKLKKSTDIRTLKKLCKPTRYTIPDTRGLHLWVKSGTNKYWIFRFTLNGKRSDMCLGSFPLVTLAEAKEKTLQVRREILKNVNPIEERKNLKNTLAAEKKSTKTFHTYANEFIEKMSPQWTSNSHVNAWVRSIEVYANPIIGNLKINTIRTEHILSILEPIWSTKTVTATRLRGRLEKILSAAITAGSHDGPNPALWNGHLENLLPNIRRATKHYKALEYQAVPTFLQKIMLSHSITSLALQFTILNATRANETLQCMKSEIVDDVWTIPAHKMKARRAHQAPLCQRSIAIIKEATALDPDSPYVFSKKGKPLTHTSMLHYVEAQGIKVTVHGFRSSFRDWVSEETNHSSEVAEMALAHAISNKVEAAYRRGNLLHRRRLLMTDWESYCLTPTKV
jgi:integrase